MLSSVGDESMLAMALSTSLSFPITEATLALRTSALVNPEDKDSNDETMLLKPDSIVDLVPSSLVVADVVSAVESVDVAVPLAAVVVTIVVSTA